jgi:hypothetical protein
MKPRSIVLPALLLICFLVAGCSKDKGTDPEETVVDIIDLLPTSGEISGWTSQGEPEEWVGESLYQPINGEAEIHFRHGFQEAAFQDYQGSGSWANARIAVRIFDQGNAEQAAALYDDPGSGSGTPWTGGEAPGADARTEQYALSCTAEFHEAEYFVHVDINSGDDQALEVVKLFARNVSLKIP